MLTFQQIIQRLIEYWSDKGCVIHQGHGLEVGAGTFNPATFLRCLGPEAYATAYVEPSRRPADGRYGDNPNRVQLFHQFQVILKPSPPDVQEMYLDCLRALDFDLKKHDIRFVHDDWEQPTIGAWGLGWEVWCDGMEITQFTYFQAIGSVPLKPISVELTIGLERLAMFIQNKDSIYDVYWNDTLTFRDIMHASEIEWSTYHFEEASPSMWLRHFEDFESQAKTLIARHLPLPAYDFVIKASHAFNILDARGVISVSERTGYIARIRDLARLIAVEYVAAREKLGFPLLKAKKELRKKAAAKVKAVKFDPKKKRDLLLEIGSEQLPATFVPIGCANLERAVKKLLEDNGLAFVSIKTFGTPQRLAVLVEGLVEGSKTQESVRRGPPLTTVFDAQGNVTPQGAGFLKSVGVHAPHLEHVRNGKTKHLHIDTVKETEYLFATVQEQGISTAHLLAQELPSLIAHLEFPKKMRWGDLDVSYARPIHWIVALFGDQVIPFTFGDITSGKTSFGHAQLSPKPVVIPRPKAYVQTLKKHFVLADVEERKATILKQLRALEKKLQGKALAQEKVLAQVLHLTEWPQLTSGQFDTAFLKVPQEVLISEMVEHQKYFPIADAKGRLKNRFLITADNRPSDLIRRGNEKVLSARLSDGAFLYAQDLETPLEQFNDKLKLMTYLKGLGTMADKVVRLSEIAQCVNRALSIADQKKVITAALLCKADLASALVGEFPELQGTIGKYYALAQQHDKEIASAIEEHWMPRAEHAPLPQTPSGVVLSLADKIDNLLSCYSTGLKPTSSSDPYALRRQAIGLLKILVDQEASVDLRALLLETCKYFPQGKGAETLVEEVLAFITARSISVFEDLGLEKGEIEACLQGVCVNPYDVLCKLQALVAFRKSGKGWAKLLEVYKRAKGQLGVKAETPFQAALAKEPAEKALLKALDVLHKQWKSLLAEKHYLEAFRAIAQLQAPLADLFDTVKILSDDLKVRANRIALLQKVFAPFQELLDFDKLQG